MMLAQAYQARRSAGLSRGAIGAGNGEPKVLIFERLPAGGAGNQSAVQVDSRRPLSVPHPRRRSRAMTDATTPGAQSSNRGIMIVLSYLWLLALVPLLVEKEDKEVQWHAKHGIVLMVAEIVLWIAVTIVSFVISSVSMALGCVVTLLTLGLWLGILVVHVLCIVKGVNGQRFIIPGVSEYASRF
jgi:uncharacterized membrane protein